MKRRNLVSATLIVAALLGATAGKAEVAPGLDNGQEIVLAAQNLSRDEMAGLSGGFIDPNGFIYRFAVNVQTQLDGMLLFVRSFVLETVNNQLQVAENSHQLYDQNLGDGKQAAVTGNGDAVVITDGQGGQTVAQNQLSNGLPSSVINNTANGMNIAQSVGLDLTISTALLDHISLNQQNFVLSDLAANTGANIRQLGF
ncbi:MAG: hypothetical protein WBK91_00045 [Alphaproteobacteria bacterium]